MPDNVDTNGWPKYAVLLMKDVLLVKESVARIEERAAAQQRSLDRVPCVVHDEKIHEIAVEVGKLKSQWTLIAGTVGLAASLLSKFGLSWLSNKGG